MCNVSICMNVHLVRGEASKRLKLFVIPEDGLVIVKVVQVSFKVRHSCLIVS